MKIANYTIDGVIGSGGMGQVLRGYDEYARKVAIKEILPEFVNNSEYRTRIDREISVLQGLNDPNVVKVYRSFEEDDRLYIVMEYVDGINLEEYVGQHGVFPIDMACNIMHKLLGTMQYVHTKGIIHRDLKPGNVMIRPSGEICLLDFGIAKDTSTDISDDERTLIGTVLGTDGYMSPEQANGCAIDRRTDIYALGCLMFFLLTGRHAFMTYADDSGRTTAEICQLPFPNVSDFRQDLPSGVQGVLEKATQKNMLKRYATCRDFSNDITTKIEKEDIKGTGGGVDDPGVTKDPMILRASKGPDLSKGGSRLKGPKPIKICVGRENCEIPTPTDIKNISRRHCEVSVHNTTGGVCYRLTNLSRNGTIVNGVTLNEGDYRDIPLNEMPVVYLSTQPLYHLDWYHVMQALASKGGPDVQHLPPQAHKPMSFIEAVKTCFNKYAYFRGRASRAEFWYFSLFNFLMLLLISVICIAIIKPPELSFVASLIILIFYSIATLLPGIAVTVRRLHDIDRSGVNYLWSFLPGVGGIIMLVFALTPGTPGPNRYGEKP